MEKYTKEDIALLQLCEKCEKHYTQCKCYEEVKMEETRKIIKKYHEYEIEAEQVLRQLGINNDIIKEKLYHISDWDGMVKIKTIVEEKEV